MPRISKEAKRNKRANWIVLTTAILLVILILIFIFWSPSAEDQTTSDDTQINQPDVNAVVRDFYECSDAGFGVQESFPARCQDAKGITHTQPVGNYLDYTDEIIIDTPAIGNIITSPLTVDGRAIGTWFFESEFSVELKDDTGKVLTQGIATTTDDWMTEELVSFTLTLTFEKPLATNRGELVFYASNASGRPEFDKTMRYPARFTTD